ncbi:MAG: crotonase/enoyl-CoA hydratase family protein [Myxococcota bacterium]|nr:crotonase/enoyl-CoA hydratase family protein [Myxococcota bacterium]
MAPEFSTISTSFQDGILVAKLNRPTKANALDHTLWFELEDLAKWVDTTPACRVLVLSAEGKYFSAGIDFSLMMSVTGKVAPLPEGQKQEALFHEIAKLQAAFSAFESCRKPVIAAIQGLCLGGGIDLIAACDIRLASKEATFSIKEIDLAIVADIGTLQRLPHIVGDAMTRDLAMTGRRFDAEEAKSMGLVSRVFDDAAALEDGAMTLARELAAKSPLTMRGIKNTLNYGRGRTVDEGLERVALWNAAMLMSKDAQEAISATVEKRNATFDD